MKSSELSKGLVTPTVNIPSSKSYANRALILGALKSNIITLVGMPDATDVVFLLEALRKVGVNWERKDTTITILNSFPACEIAGAPIEVGEGGTTARFLAAMLLRGCKPHSLVLGDRLKDRPWDEFIALVRQLGGKASLEGNTLTLQGPLKIPPRLEVDCSRTTQFASALQLSFHDMAEVVPVHLKASESYWQMTEQMIPQISQQDVYRIPLDWSSASYPLAFGALNQAIDFPGLKYDPFQADAKFMSILTELDALEETTNGIRVYPMKNPHSLSVDVSDCLDLVPALSFLLAHIEGEHHLQGVGNLVFKESDRLEEIIRLLAFFGRKTRKSEDQLIIYGERALSSLPATLRFPEDHRMVMTGALFLKHHNGGILGPMDAVNKSYPGFFNLFV